MLRKENLWALKLAYAIPLSVPRLRVLSPASMTWIVEIKRIKKMQLWQFQGKLWLKCYKKRKTLPLEPFDEHTSITNISSLLPSSWNRNSIFCCRCELPSQDDCVLRTITFKHVFTRLRGTGLQCYWLIAWYVMQLICFMIYCNFFQLIICC